MKTDLQAALIIMGIAVGILLVCRIMNASGWNSGYCSCGGKWEYKQAIGHRYETTYLYECDKCGKTIEFFEKYAEAEE